MMRSALLLAIAAGVGCSSPPPPPDTVEMDPGAAAPADVTEAVLDTPWPATPPETVAPSDAPPPPSGQAPPVAPGVRGRVGASGTDHEPMTTLQVEGRRALIITGPLESELRSLAGATVVVRGTESGAARRTIQVESYEIVEINGERPFVGLVLPGDRLAAGADTLTLEGAPDALRAGDRVWITGERRGTRLRVSSWGAIGGDVP